MIKEDFIKLLDQKHTNSDFLNQNLGYSQDDFQKSGSWLGNQKYAFELTIQQVDITNVDKAPSICTENDLIKLAVNLEDSPHSDALQLQKIKSYPALIKRSRTNHILTLSWNQTFHFLTSMQSDKLGGVTSKEVIRIKVFKIGQDNQKNESNSNEINDVKNGSETVLAECDLILLQEVVESYMLQDSSAIKGQLTVYEVNTDENTSGDDHFMRRKSGIGRLAHGGKRRERLGNLQYELKVQSTSQQSDTNSNSPTSPANVNMIKLEMDDLDGEKIDDKKMKSASNAKYFLQPPEVETAQPQDQLSNKSGVAQTVSSLLRNERYSPETGLGEFDKEFQKNSSIGRRSFGRRDLN